MWIHKERVRTFATVALTAFTAMAITSCSRPTAEKAGRLWAGEFEAAFPTPTGELAVTPVKRLDFLIWGGAAR